METEILQERLELAVERIDKIEEEQSLPEAFDIYFRRVARFLIGEEEKKEPYAQSYLNPAYAGEQLGEELGRFLSALYYEMYSLTGLRGQEELQEFVIRMELFLEIYGIFLLEWQENRRLPGVQSLRQSFYWFAFDYADVAAEKYVKELAKFAEGDEEGTNCLRSTSILYGFLPETKARMISLWKEGEREEDHRTDVALVLDKAYVSRKLEVFRTALEQQKDLMRQKKLQQQMTLNQQQESVSAAQLEKVIPSRRRMQSQNPAAIIMSGEQKKLWAEYCRQAENIWNEHCGLTSEI